MLPIRPSRTLYAGKNKMFQILSRDLAATTTGEYPYASIVIADSHSQFGRLPASEHQKGVLRLKFDDNTEPMEGMVGFDTRHAHQILDFLEQNQRKVSLFIINCEMGKRRSAAVGAALSRIVNGEDAWFFEHLSPDRHIYETLLAVWKERQQGSGKQITPPTAIVQS